MLSLMLMCSANADWVQTNGPYGASVLSFAVSDTNLFAGTGGGGFISTSNGTHRSKASHHRRASLGGFPFLMKAIQYHS
jgi:hypothetical protein